MSDFDSSNSLLTKFENSVYTHQPGKALELLSDLSKCLVEERGTIQCIVGDASVSMGEQALSTNTITELASRLACAISALIVQPGFKLEGDIYTKLMVHRQALDIIFGAAGMPNMDPLLTSIELDSKGFPAISDNWQPLYLFTLLYSIDSCYPIDWDAMWDKQPHVAIMLAASQLSQVVCATPEAHQKREELLKWLPAKLDHAAQQGGYFIPMKILHYIWMYCSYAEYARKHDIKKPINKLILILTEGLNLHTQTGKKGTNRPHFRHSKKPVLMVILEAFSSGHSIFRTHSTSMRALRRHYHLVGVGFDSEKTDQNTRRVTDQNTRKVFDTFLQGETRETISVIKRLDEWVDEYNPGVVYFPSVGMSPEIILAANLRWAPLQIAALGHPATTHSQCVDCVLVEEDYLGDPSCFVERVVALPPEAIPYIPSSFNPNLKPIVRRASGAVRIAVAASAIKFAPAFLDVCGRIWQESSNGVEFYFLLGLSRGLHAEYMKRIIRQHVPIAQVYPESPYKVYLERINLCDMFLNPFPFGNTNGIIDTVGQGLPGVCMTGPEVHSMIDAGLFRRMQVPEWLIANNMDEYVKAAVQLIDDDALREQISHDLIDRKAVNAVYGGKPEKFADAVWWLDMHQTEWRAQSDHVLRPPV